MFYGNLSGAFHILNDHPSKQIISCNSLYNELIIITYYLKFEKILHFVWKYLLSSCNETVEESLAHLTIYSALQSSWITLEDVIIEKFKKYIKKYTNVLLNS